MIKEEHNKIFYDPMNEIVCDRFALEKLVNESEAKDQRIAELEEQLRNAIVLPILAEQEIYYVYETDIAGDVAYTIDEGFVGSISIDVNDIWFRGIYDSGLTYWHLLKDFNNEVFATKEEALVKLEELGGSDVKD